MDDTHGQGRDLGGTRTCRCLVCGILSNLFLDEAGSRIRVKREHDNEEEQLLEPEVEERPCFECGGSSLRFHPPEEKSLEWEIKLFQSFLQVLLKSRKGNARKSQWNFPEEVVPLCDKCEDQVSSLVRIYDQLKAMEKKFSAAMKIVRLKMVQAEQIFQQEDKKIYQEDERYYWARSEVVGKSKIGLAPSRASRGAKISETRKRSDRSKLKLSEVKDKVAVESDSKVKPEPQPEVMEDIHFEDDINDDDNDHLDFEPPTSPLPPLVLDDMVPQQEAKPSTSSSISNCPPRGWKRDLDAIRSSDIREGKRNWKSVVYKDDLADDLVTYLDEEPQIKPKPKNTARPNVKKSDDDEDFNPDTVKEVADEVISDSDSDFDGDDNAQLENVIRGPNVKGVQYFCKTLQIQFRQVKFYPIIGEKQFRCTLCDEIVESQPEVKRHVEQCHSGGKKLNQCPQPGCKFKAKLKAVVDKHIRRNHADSNLEWKDPKKRECDICGRMVWRRYLDYHKVTHMGTEERAEAEARGDLAKWKDKAHYDQKEMKRKERTTQQNQVTSNDSQICPDCGKTFAKPLALKTHIRMNHKEMPFVCTFCEMKFPTQQRLTDHKVIHTGERPFHCDRCPREFLTQKKLDEHMDLHNNIRPHLCSQCPMAFVNKGQLSKHLKESHAPGSEYPKRRSFNRGPVQRQFLVMSKWTKNVYYGESQLSEKRTRACPHEGCPAAFQYPSQLKRHLTRYHDNKESEESHNQDQDQQKGQGQFRGHGIFQGSQAGMSSMSVTNLQQSQPGGGIN